MFTRKNAQEIETLKRQILDALPKIRSSPQSALYSYRQKKSIPLAFVLVNQFNEPILVASLEGGQAKILFSDYPKLNWICDLSTQPVRVLNKSGSMDLSELIGSLEKEPKSHPILISFLALGLSLALMLFVVLSC